MIRRMGRGRLAEECKVSQATIVRDAQFATAVDALAEKLGDEAREKILSREAHIKKK
jgi:hypothetical protein